MKLLHSKNATKSRKREIRAKSQNKMALSQKSLKNLCSFWPFRSGRRVRIKYASASLLSKYERKFFFNVVNCRLNKSNFNNLITISSQKNSCCQIKFDPPFLFHQMIFRTHTNIFYHYKKFFWISRGCENDQKQVKNRRNLGRLYLNNQYSDFPEISQMIHGPDRL